MCGIGIAVEGIQTLNIQKLEEEIRKLTEEDKHKHDTSAIETNFHQFFYVEHQTNDKKNDDIHFIKNDDLHLEDILPSQAITISSTTKQSNPMDMKMDTHNLNQNWNNVSHTQWNNDDTDTNITQMNSAPLYLQNLLHSLHRRGPDYTGYWKSRINHSDSKTGPQQENKYSWLPTTIHLIGSVLHMSGTEMIKQPVMLNDGSYFVYNGEIFGIRNPTKTNLGDVLTTRLGGTISSNSLNTSVSSDASLLLRASTNLFSTCRGFSKQCISDTEWLRIEINQIIDQMAKDYHNADSSSSFIYDVSLRQLLECIEGPFSFIHVCPKRNRIFCMRDMFGRRSLCVNLIDLENTLIHHSNEVDNHHENKNCRKKCDEADNDEVDAFIYDSSSNSVNDAYTHVKNHNDINLNKAKSIPSQTPYENDDKSKRKTVLCIANVAMGNNAIELPCSGAFVFDLDRGRMSEENMKYCIRHFPRCDHHKSPFQSDSLHKFWKCNDDNNQIHSIDDEILKSMNEKMTNENTVMDVKSQLSIESKEDTLLSNDLFKFQNNRILFRNALTNAIRRHIIGHSCISILFSGGVDSSVIAALTAQELQKQYNEECSKIKSKCDANNFMKPTLELINVSFDPEKGPDRHTALRSLHDLLTSCFPMTAPDVKYEIYLVDKDYYGFNHSEVMKLLGPNSTVMDFNIAAALWCGSEGCGFRLRWWTELTKDLNKHSLLHENKDNDEDFIRQEMLILKQLMTEAYVPLFKKPGSETSRKSLHHMIRMSFQDSFNSDEIKQKTNHQGSSIINCSLYQNYYRYTLQDQDTDNQIGYKLPKAKGKVLLVGHGADELMGGYARHISAFEKRGQLGLVDEMGKDLTRLWQRNLGRDDRVLSDFGRESRHPFLDEEFIDCIRTLPPLVDKIYLRDLASSNDIGLKSSAARFEKRAIQFGTRIAQKSNKAICGTNRKGKGNVPFIVK